jgi:hypothetical protein
MRRRCCTGCGSGCVAAVHGNRKQARGPPLRQPLAPRCPAAPTPAAAHPVPNTREKCGIRRRWRQRAGVGEVQGVKGEQRKCVGLRRAGRGRRRRGPSRQCRPANWRCLAARGAPCRLACATSLPSVKRPGRRSEL